MNPIPHVDITWEAAGVVAAIFLVIQVVIAGWIRLQIRVSVADAVDRMVGTFVTKEVCLERHGLWKDEVERRLRELKGGKEPDVLKGEHHG